MYGQGGCPSTILAPNKSKITITISHKNDAQNVQASPPHIQRHDNSVVHAAIHPSFVKNRKPAKTRRSINCTTSHIHRTRPLSSCDNGAAFTWGGGVKSTGAGAFGTGVYFASCRCSVCNCQSRKNSENVGRSHEMKTCTMDWVNCERKAENAYVLESCTVNEDASRGRENE